MAGLNPVSATLALRDAARSDSDLRLALVLIAERSGYPDFLAYAAEHPDEVVMMAEAQLEIEDQNPPGMRKL